MHIRAGKAELADIQMDRPLEKELVLCAVGLVGRLLRILDWPASLSSERGEQLFRAHRDAWLAVSIEGVGLRVFFLFFSLIFTSVRELHQESDKRWTSAAILILELQTGATITGYACL